MLSFACTACQKKLVVKEELAGKRVKCPGCGTVTRIPGAAAVTQEAGAGEVRSVTSRSTDERTVPPTADARSIKAPPLGEQPTVPPSSQSRATESPTPDIGDHDSSLTDFLAPPQSDDELGRLGGFRILKILGHGGMGVVFQGEDPKLGRKVAIKAMLPHLAESKSAQQRFLREARAAAALEHDHIVAIHHVGEDRGAPFIVMPFLKGEPLDARLRREKGMPIREVLRIGREVAEGLACAHASGLIHRDIKPANIWLEGRSGEPGASATGGRVKILDFGLARATAQEAGLTQQGAIIGTPSYMAPEQARGEKVDARCDLWSLGVVLYQLSTGELPFHGNDAVSTLMAVAMTDPPPPNELNPKLPARLSNLIMELLTKDPADRLADSQEVADTLREFAEKCGASDDFVAAKTETRPRAQFTQPAADEDTDSDRPRRKKKSTATMAVEERPRKHAKSRLPLYLGIGGGVAAAAIAGVLILGGKRDENRPMLDGDKSQTDAALKSPVLPKKESPAAFGNPISPLALVQRPATIPGVESWSIETRGHLGPARELAQLALSPDPMRFATGGDDGSVRIWERRAGELHLVRLLMGHEGPIKAIDWSPDGKIIASAGGNNAVRLWEPSTGKVLRTLHKHSGPVRALAWSPDSKSLASGSHDHTVLLWNVATGESVTKFTGHAAGIIEMGWLTEKTVVSMDGQLRAWTWDAKSGNSLKSHAVKSRFWGAFAQWNENRSVLAYKLSDDEVTLWIAPSGQTRTLQLKELQGKLATVAVSPDGKTLATASEAKIVQLWDADSGRLISSGQHGGHGVFGLRFSPDGKTVVSTNMYGGCVLWNVDPSAKEADPKGLAKPLAIMHSFCHYPWTRWSADSKLFYTKSAVSMTLHDAEAARAKLAATPAGQDPAAEPSYGVPAHESGLDAAWSRDSTRLALLKRPWWTQIWDVSLGQFDRQSMDREGGGPYGWSPDGKTLALSMHWGSTLKLWNLAEANRDQLLTTKGVRAVAWSKDGKRFATGEENGVRIWETAGPKEVKTLQLVPQPGQLASSSNDELITIVADKSNVASLWDASTGLALPTKFEAHQAPLQAMALSPDGLTLATGDDAGMIRLSAVKTGKSLKFFQAHEGRVHTLAWQDSQTLLSLGGRVLEGNQGGTLHFWQIDADKPTRTFKGLPARGWISPDGKLLAAGPDSARWQIWETATGRPRTTLVSCAGPPELHPTISSEGHYRMDGDTARCVVYVVQTSSGQETLSPEEFEKRFGWKNEPEKVALAPK